MRGTKPGLFFIDRNGQEITEAWFMGPYSGKCGRSSEPGLWSQLSHAVLAGMGDSTIQRLGRCTALPSSSIFVYQGNGLHRSQQSWPDRQGKAGHPDITFVVYCFIILSHDLVVCNVSCYFLIESCILLN